MNRMVIMKTPFIIPSRSDWFVLLILMGIFGFCAQVLMTMGLQRETAGRASMALYTQVMPLLLGPIFVTDTQAS